MQGELPVERMCQLAGVSRAGFYRHLVEVEPDQEEMELRDAIQRIYLGIGGTMGTAASLLNCVIAACW